MKIILIFSISLSNVTGQNNASTGKYLQQKCLTAHMRVYIHKKNG